MRSCPKCGRTYGDEYNFCLLDGTLLSFSSDGAKTEVLHPSDTAADSVPTIESHDKNEPAPTIKIPTSDAPETPLPTIAAFRPKRPVDQAPQKKRSVGRIIAVVAVSVVAVVIVLSLIGGIIVGIVESSRDHQIAAANTTPTVMPRPSPKASITPSVTPTPTPTPDPTPTKPIVIPNPTLDPKTLPPPEAPNMEGRYYLRQTDDDTVVMTFDVYVQDGPNFYIRNDDDKLYGTVHLDRTEKNELVGYVVWENSAGDKDREIMYICMEWKGLCGKLPFQSWYFVATKR